MGAAHNPMADMPPITEAHLRMAFERVALAGWKFDDAMANAARRQVIVTCAHAIRTKEWERTHKRTVVPVKRVRLGVDGHPIGYCTQMVRGHFEPITQPELAL